MKKSIVLMSAAFHATLAVLLLVVCGGDRDNKPSTPSPIGIFDEIRALMAEHYFDRSRLPAINAGLEAVENNQGTNLSERLNRFFDSLQVSHIGLFTPDDIEYYELLEIFKFVHADRLKKMFPPDGAVKYPGIGIVPRLIDGRYHVAFVYAGTPATGADILTVDGQQYSPVGAFQGKVGKTVKLTLRRVRDGPALEREVAVEALNPTETLAASTAGSSRIIERGGRRLGYIRMYSYAGAVYGQILADTISGNNFAAADALILDIRSRWGGAPLDAAEMFVGGTPTVEFTTAANEVRTLNFRWTRPLVAIIGPETRSGLEIMAYSLKKAGVPMVGSNTRGAVLGGATFFLSDGNLLMIPCTDSRVDGRRLEGVGVAPTLPVDAVLEYSTSHHPKLHPRIPHLQRSIGLQLVIAREKPVEGYGFFRAGRYYF